MLVADKQMSHRVRQCGKTSTFFTLKAVLQEGRVGPHVASLAGNI